MRRDPELLRAFSRQADEPAFAELVVRHLPLVYGVAVRVLGGDAHAAQDVAQTVFTALARKARSLEDRDSLAGWLHTVAHHAAVQRVRSETRRRQREERADLMSDELPESAIDWDQLRPVIDETLETLSERDRTAVLLRFFEGLPFAEVGQRLALSEDAARMRVDRALEKLRAALAKRGVKSATAALGGALAAQGAVSVPAGVVAHVSTTALAGAAATGGSFLTTIFMMTSQKVLVVAAALAVGGVAFQAWQAHERSCRLRAAEARVATLERELAEIRGRLGSAQAEIGATDRVLSDAEQVLAALDPKAIAARERLSPELKAWLERCEKLRAVAAADPARTIPEMALLTDEDWMDVARRADLTSEEGRRKALKWLRAQAKSNAVPLLMKSLDAYLEAHGQIMPPSIDALTPFAPPPLDAAMLLRYRVAVSGSVENLREGSKWIVETDRRDDEYETEINVGRFGSGSRDVSYVNDAVFDATRAYMAAHGNKMPKDPSEVIPFLTDPSDPKVLQYLERAKQRPGK